MQHVPECAHAQERNWEGSNLPPGDDFESLHKQEVMAKVVF